MRDGSVDGKRVVVVGGTGSLGRRLAERLLSGDIGRPSKVIVFSRDEAKQHEMRLAFLHRAATDEIIFGNFLQTLEFRIGDVRDFASLRGALDGADVVVTAAALKQVPVCEYFPEQAILTNCLGAANIVRAVSELGGRVQAVVGLSTDKACHPFNVMGMTKALQERIFVAANVTCPSTRFVSVRYGNVLGSRGSVIPLFHEQIRRGGPVTLTVPEMTRFLVTLDQAVETIFAALRFAHPGETLVPRAPSTTVGCLARALVGDRPIPIVSTGIRPGEKYHETLVSREEAPSAYPRDGYIAVSPMLPELRREVEESAPLDHEYSSNEGILGLEATRELLGRAGFLAVPGAEPAGKD